MGTIIGTLPIMPMSVAVMLPDEWSGRAVLGTIGLVAVGVLAVALQPRGDATHPLLDNLPVMGAVMCEGLFILLNERLHMPVPPLALSALVSAFGLLTALLSGLWEASWQLHVSAQATYALVAVVYYVIISMVGGFTLWYAGAACMNGAEAPLLTVLTPVAAAVLVVTLLGEAVSARQAGGTVCIPTGMLSLGLARMPQPVTTMAS